MRYVLILVSILLVACGGSGGGNDISSGTPSDLPPGCKSIYSVWQSTSDQEEHDFRGLENEITLQEYEYQASEGSTCGYTTNPNHNLSAKLIVAENLSYTVSWHYQLQMKYSLAMGGQCGTYTVFGSVGNKDQAAFISMTCDEIQICKDAYSNSLGNCKTFK